MLSLNLMKCIPSVDILLYPDIDFMPKDGCWSLKVGSTACWSFANNWEFGDYKAHFGLQTVNRTTQIGNYKKSFFDLVGFVNARKSPASS